MKVTFSTASKERNLKLQLLKICFTSCVKSAVKCSVINFGLQYPTCSSSEIVLKKRKIKLNGDFWLHSDFSTFFWKECESTCESSPHLIDSCMSKTQTQKPAIYKLTRYLWSKVSKEDSSTQQGGVSRGFVKLCESGIRSGTQNFAEGLFLWAPAASAHGLFYQFFPPPPSLRSPQQTWAECQQSIMWHTYSTALPVPSPKYPLHQDQHTREERSISSSWELGLHGEFTMGKHFWLLLGNPPMQHSINTCQIWSLLSTGFIQ